jgi:uncharacterized membrane protein YqjE
MELLHRQLFGGITVLHALLGVIGLFVLMTIVEKIRGKPAADTSLNVDVRCACGWKGSVSKYTRRCPKCGGDVMT